MGPREAARRFGARRSRVLLVLAAIGVLATFGPPLTATASIANTKSFTTLEAPYTQELLSSGPGTVTGAAFAPDGDVWFTNCGGGDIYRVDLQTPAPPQGGSELSTVGPAVPAPVGCGLVNHPNGSMYSNHTSGVTRFNADTGAQIGTGFGPAGNELGIAVDPVTGNLVYVGSDGAIHFVDADLTTSGVYSPGPYNNVDGIYFEPTGQFLFMADRSSNSIVIVKRDGTILQSVPVGAPLDGIAFKAVAPKFVLTNNTDGTMSKLSFPNDDFSQTPTITQFASGGFYGDITNVGPDGCLYVSQLNGTRFADNTTSSGGSIVRICSGFAPPPGAGQEGPSFGNCADGIDNDGDGLVDTADPDCPAPTTTTTVVTTTTTAAVGSTAATPVAARPAFTG